MQTTERAQGLPRKTMANRHKFLFVYNEHCKKIEIENDNPNGARMKELMEEANVLFGVDKTNTLLQRWDTDFECFVDIDDDEPAENISGGVKIKIQPKVLIIPVRLDNVVQQIAAQEVIAEKPKEPIAKQSKEPADASDGDVQMEEVDQDGVQNQKSASCWAVEWQLADLPPAIHNKLSSLPAGNDLKTSERSTIFGIIFKSVMKHNYYPKPTEYHMMIEQLFRIYSKLNQTGGVTFGSRKALYKKKLTYYFQNRRDEVKKDLTDVNFKWRQQKKKKDGFTACTVPTTASNPPVWGIANYLPPMPESEDENSIQRHIRLMQEEKKKKYPDIKRIDLAMNITLSARRAMIVQKHSKVSEIANVYPWLFEEIQLMSEMERLIAESDGQGYQARMNSGFKKFGMAIVKYGRSLKPKSTPQCFKTLLDRIPIQKDHKEHQDAVTRAAIVMIPTMFREKIESIFQSGDHDDIISPIIKCNSSPAEATVFETKVDEVVVATSYDIISAFYCYMATIYTFNLYNPKSVAKSTLFVEKVILQLQDNQSVQPLQNIVSKLINLL